MLVFTDSVTCMPYIDCCICAVGVRQARASSALSSRDPGPNSLKNCWDTLRWESTSFLEVVTGCFPTAKVGPLRRDMKGGICFPTAKLVPRSAVPEAG